MVNGEARARGSHMQMEKPRGHLLKQRSDIHPTRPVVVSEMEKRYFFPNR